jgi:hypothetical protein
MAAVSSPVSAARADGASTWTRGGAAAPTLAPVGIEGRGGALTVAGGVSVGAPEDGGGAVTVAGGVSVGAPEAGGGAVRTEAGVSSGATGGGGVPSEGRRLASPADFDDGPRTLARPRTPTATSAATSTVIKTTRFRRRARRRARKRSSR